jgi:hypothetical protein
MNLLGIGKNFRIKIIFYDIRKNKMKITIDQILNQWQEWLTDVDNDILAEMTGKIFGGDCAFISKADVLYDNLEFEFIPNDDYMGVFDKE